MDLNKLTLTNLVIEWLEKESYSKNHWQTIANEMLEKSNGDPKNAIDLTAQALADFHTLYKNKVVQENNLLHSLLTECFARVEWRLVAKRFIS